jgi:hypothetical protein
VGRAQRTADHCRHRMRRGGRAGHEEGQKGKLLHV